MIYPALKDRMKWLGMEQKQLAENIGVKPSVLQKKLSGEWHLDVGTAIKIAHAVGKTVEELFRYYEEE